MATPKTTSGMPMRQKIVMVSFVVVLLILAWLIYGTFKGETRSAPPPLTTTNINAGAPGGLAPPGGAQLPVPKQSEIVKPEPLSPREAQLLQLQQATEAKYVEALNELQMLRVERDIAETNKAIATARLDTITAQKNIVNLLKPPAPVIPPTTYAQGLVNPTGAGGAPGGPPTSAIKPPPEPETNYTVISVSFLKERWNAVLGYQGTLYNVHVGDIIPVDGSKVINIDTSGLILERNGMRRKISMVPII